MTGGVDDLGTLLLLWAHPCPIDMCPIDISVTEHGATAKAAHACPICGTLTLLKFGCSAIC